jgi:hypothetical protein
LPGTINSDRMQNEVMDQDQDREFGKNWVTSSRFLFYVTVLTYLAFVAGCSYQVYEHRYRGKPKVEVPENTLYTPKYK